MFNTKNIRRIVIGTAASLTLVTGLVWSSGFPVERVLAQAVPTQLEEGNVFQVQDGRGRGGNFGFSNRGNGQSRRGGFGQRGGSSFLLANALGVTPVQLQEAQESAKNALIDQAAAAGVITPEQAAQLKEGQRPTGDVSGLRTFMADADRDAALAQALDITPEALATAKDNMVQMGVDAGLITQEQGNQMLLHQKIREATKAAMEQAINEAVAEGLITQEEADQMLSGRGRFGPDRGGRRGGPSGFRQGPGNNFGGFDGGPQGRTAPDNAFFSNL
ncbi:MAG: hypothetical protein AAF702_00990 [Chloroflexota bacterium]